MKGGEGNKLVEDNCGVKGQTIAIEQVVKTLGKDNKDVVVMETEIDCIDNDKDDALQLESNMV